MMIHFLRGFIFFVKLMILVMIGVLLSQYPGQAHLTWFGYQIDTSIGILLAGIFFSVAVILLILGAWRSLWRFPIIWAERRKARRLKKSEVALIEGITAVAAGEFLTARRLGKRALSLNDQNPLTLLLSAQSAYMSGKHEEAQAHFLAMSKKPKTAFLGLRGLILQAHQMGNWEQMRNLLQDAMNMRPQSPWVLQQLFELDLRLGSFDKASMMIEQMQLRQLITKPESRRRQALVHWMKAEAAKIADDENLFVQAATSAHYEAPEISTIAIHLASHYHKIGKDSKAQKILMSSYAYNPHKDFGDLLLSLNESASPLDHYRDIEKLVEGAPNHPESLYILAVAAKKAKLWGQARHYLNLLKNVQYSKRVCALMAEIEEAENPHQTNQGHEWRTRMETAPNDPTWMCKSCYVTLPTWQTTCSSCGTFDAIVWQPSSSSPKSISQKETPLLVG